MDYIIIISFIILIIIIAVISNFRMDKRRRERFGKKLIEEFGGPVNEDYSKERLEAITGYNDYHKDDDPFYIDDITWNDMEGDRLLRHINRSYSSLGDEYLYYLLRHPSSVNGEDTDTFESHIEYLTENEKERLKLQFLFASLGRMGKFSIYKYIDNLKILETKSLWIFFVDWLIYAAFIALIFVNTPVGLILLGLWGCVNIVFYLKCKGPIGPFITSFDYILRLLKCSEKFVKTAPDEYDKEKKELKSLRKKLSAIKDGGLYFIKQGKGQGSGDILELLISLSNMLTLADLFVFYRMLSQVMDYSTEIDSIFTILARVDNEISVAAFRKSLPHYSKPVYDANSGMSATGIFHPLITDAVDNDFDIVNGMLVTGTNASGKSTFLRTILLNAVLSQCINTSVAKSYHGKKYRIFSSMSLKDSLLAGDSYYMAEIKSIRRILTASEIDGAPVLCVVDEVLRGTNTVERIAAACQIMKSLSKPEVCLFAATHDYELTELLKDYLDNCHFTEEISGDDIKFNYKLVKGACSSRNAIALLKLMGYSDSIVQNAMNMTQHFVETNSWELV